MEEILRLVFSNPETVNKIITELGPKALDNAEHIVISGIETTGQVVECLIKDGKIVEHTAKTAQEAVKSTENVAISIVETGGRVCEYLIKDGEIVRHTAETVQIGIETTGDVAKELIDKGTETAQVSVKTTGEIVKELIDRGTDTINTAIETTGNVVASSISERYAYKTAKESEKTERNRDNNLTKQEAIRKAGDVVAGSISEKYAYKTATEAEKTERNRDNNLTKQEAIRKAGDVLGMKVLVDGKVKTIEWESLVEICQAAINSGNPEIGAQMLAMKYQTNAEQAKAQSEKIRGNWKLLTSTLTRVAALGASIFTFNPIPAAISEGGHFGGKLIERFQSKKDKDEKGKIEKTLEFTRDAYEFSSMLNTNFPSSQFPELGPIKRLLDASVKQENPELIALTIQVIQEEVDNLQAAQGFQLE